jgi:hypothetical protein
VQQEVDQLAPVGFADKEELFVEDKYFCSL